MSDGMQCVEHPYRTNPAGGICPLCLQDKLRNLLSSSFPFPLRGSYSSSSSSSSYSPPSFTSQAENIASAGNGVAVIHASSSSLSLSLSARPPLSTSVIHNSNGGNCEELYTRSTRIPFLLARKKTKKKKTVASSSSEMVFRRSKSTATPSRGTGTHYMEDKRGGFWSFLYLSSSKPHDASKKTDKDSSSSEPASTLSSSSSAARSDIVLKPKERALASSSMSKKGPIVIMEDDYSPSNQTNNIKASVSRSRSVGCGSRSFSGDLFERISTGFGDCALRRVESQRETKPRFAPSSSSAMKDRVKCGGIFGGFVLTPSAHSSPHWVSSSSAEHVVRGRSRSWVWAFASPMRAFNKPGSKGTVPRSVTSSNNTAPNLSATPSLLAVRS